MGVYERRRTAQEGEIRQKESKTIEKKEIIERRFVVTCWVCDMSVLYPLSGFPLTQTQTHEIIDFLKDLKKMPS